MKPKPAKEEIAFTLRLPINLHERLVAEAAEEKRTRHSHIVYLLDKNVRKITAKEKTK